MLHIFNDIDALITGTADYFVKQGVEAIARNGRFSVALSGGSSPQKLFTLLASETYKHKLEWSNVFFFFGDERFVPADHPSSNYRMAKETLFEPLSISGANVFPVDTTVSPEQSAKLYEQALRKHFDGDCRFDLILLGLGDNSHTASLFPHTKVLHEKEALIKEEFVAEVNQFRITFTAPLINNAAEIAFLLFGAGKADAVHHILKDPFNPEEYPAQLIKPVNGNLHWFMDRAAAARVA